MKIDNRLSDTISWAQFICSIVIILDHSFDYLNYSQVSKNLFEQVVYFISKMFSGGLTYGAMAIFFLLSSFLLYKDWNEKEDLSNWYMKKLKSRFISLAIPYLLWNLIWTIFFLGAGALDKSGLTNVDGRLSLNDFLSGVFLGKYNEVFWYIKILMLYVVISPLIGGFIEKGKSFAVLIGFILSCTLFLPLHKIYFYNFFNFFFWCLGAYIAICQKHDSQLATFIHKKPMGIKDIVFFMISLCLLTWLQIFDYRSIFNYSIFFTNAVVLAADAILSLSFWNIIYFQFCEKRSEWYTNASFLIYAMHKPIQQAFNKIIARFFSANLFTYLFNQIGGLAFTLVLILLFVFIMKKLFPAVLSVVNGGRRIG